VLVSAVRAGDDPVQDNNSIMWIGAILIWTCACVAYYLNYVKSQKKGEDVGQLTMDDILVEKPS
jgi:hypothetical protein